MLKARPMSTKFKKSNADYLVKVGEEADHRLKILNNIFRRASCDFFAHLGLSKGMTVLEVGCGTGHVTIDLAELVGPTGHVHAVDISAEQIEVARSNVQAQGLNNVTFEVVDVKDLHKQNNTFQFVVTRFVLMHLTDPKAALAAMYHCVAPGGFLACEEPEMSCCYSSIESGAFEKAIQWQMSYGIKKQLDFDIGNKLLPMFQELSFSSPQEIVTQPHVKSPQPGKNIYCLLTEESRDKFVEAGIATAKEISDVLQELSQLTNNTDAIFGCARQHQVSARKPGFL